MQFTVTEVWYGTEGKIKIDAEIVDAPEWSRDTTMTLYTTLHRLLVKTVGLEKVVGINCVKYPKLTISTRLPAGVEKLSDDQKISWTAAIKGALK